MGGRGVDNHFCEKRPLYGQFIKEIRENPQNHGFWHITSSIPAMKVNDTIYLVENFATNLMNTKFVCKKLIMTSL